jgi:hypothetical protein
MSRTGGTGLTLAGHRLRMCAADLGGLRESVSLLAPPCDVDAGLKFDPEWTINISAGGPGERPVVEAGRPVLSWPEIGRCLTVLAASDGMLRLACRYRSNSAVTVIEVDRQHRSTRVSLPPGDPASARWPDWVARAFFGSRLLDDGWQLVHASAVGLPTSAGQRALLVLAGQHGGKSTMAHRACTELGATFMADDLVLLRADPDCIRVVGWPTRVCVPAELLPATVGSAPFEQIVHSLMAGQPRRRLVISPTEHERLFGVVRSGPAALGGVLLVLPTAVGSQADRAGTLAREGLAAAVTEAADVPAQRLMMVDILGVAGPAASMSRQSSSAAGLLADGLERVPAAVLAVADPSRLHNLPVWRLLKPHLSLLQDIV